MFTISVLNNTNRIITSSQDNLSSIRDGSFIKIGIDDILYNIARTNKFFYIKDFDIFSPRVLIINDDIGINLQRGDTIKISYKEYELNTITEIKNKGKFYAINDLLIVKDGEPSTDVLSGLSYPTKLNVTKINEMGGIEELSAKDMGKYIIPPNGDCEVIGGNGEGAILNLNYDFTDNRKIIERTIENIDVKEGKTYITLNYSLNNGIQKGKLSTEKWEIILSSNYVGDSKVNVSFEIYKDFTPHLKLPLLVRNSQSIDLIFNKAMAILEKEILELKRKIGNN